MKLHQGLFWLLVFFLPTQFGKHFWPDFAFVSGIRVDYFSPTIYITDLLVVGILISWLWEGQGKWLLGISNWWRRYWLVGVIFIYLVLTSFLARNSGAAFYKLGRVIEFSFLAFYVAKNTQLLTSSITKLISLSVIYESVLAILQFLKQGSLGGLFWYLGERTFNAGTPGISLAELGGRLFLRPYGTFSHPNSLAGFLVVSLILIFGLGRLPVWLKVIALTLGILTIFLSFSQAVWLAGLLAGLWWLCFRKTENKLPLFTVSFLFIVVFVGTFGFLLDINDWAIWERVQLIKAAAQMIRDSVFTGVGLNNFIVWLPVFWSRTGIYLLQPVHNIFLLVAVEIGLVGLVIFLWFLGLTIKRTISQRQHFLTLTLVVILLIGLFDHYWLTLQQNQLLATIILGLAWGKIKT